MQWYNNKKNREEQIMKKKLTVLLILALLICLKGYAFEVEGYRWGAYYSEVKQKIRDSKKNLSSANIGNILAYNDYLLGEHCYVNFMFTAASNVNDGKLAAIEVEWKEISPKQMERIAMEAITKRLGKPKKSDPESHYYEWEDGAAKNIVVLNCYVNAKLSFRSGKHYKVLMNQKIKDGGAW